MNVGVQLLNESLRRFELKRVPLNYFPSLIEIEEESSPKYWTEGMFRSEFTNPYSEIYGVFLGKELAAFAVFHLVLDEVSLANLGVRKAYRRQGVARLLLSEQFSRFHQRGYQTVNLEVRHSNYPARLLYENLGFFDVGRRVGYYREPTEDAHLLRLELSSS